MTFLPIVERELRVASRRSGTYWSRAQVAMAGLVPTFFLLAGPTGFMTPAQRGSEIFQLLAYLAFFFVIISAVRFTALAFRRSWLPLPAIRLFRSHTPAITVL